MESSLKILGASLRYHGVPDRISYELDSSSVVGLVEA